MSGHDPYIGAQILSFAIPLGVFCVALVLGFFARRRNL